MAIIVPARVGEVINIGRAGENKATIVTFDVTDWLEEFGNNGQFTLIIQQGGEEVYVQGIISPGTGTGQLSGVVQWEVTSSNTAIVGAGKCELIYEINQVIVKSIIYDILVTNSLDIELQTEAPEPIITWLNNLDDRIIEINNAYQYANNAAQSANEAAASVSKIENLTVNAITGNAGEDASVSKTIVGSGNDSHYHFSFTLPKGDTGKKGDKGDKGDRGALFWNTTVAPSTPNYTFTISNLTGNTGESPQVGDIVFYSYYKYVITSITSSTVFSSTRVSLRGATGETGEQGPTGPAATIAIGTVTTGNAGSSATVTNSGTSTNATLNFTIPKGDKGDTGNAAGFGTPTAVIDNSLGSVGIPGVSISASGSNTAKVFNFKFGNLKGDKGDTGNAAGFGTPTASINNTVGTPGVTVTASGENTAKVFNFAFSNLKGEKGDKGDTGAITVGNVTTGNAGSSAIITNSGTSTDAVLNFTIPKGDKGDTGAITVGTVTTGNAGSSVIITNSGTPSDAVLNFTIPKGDKGEQGTGFAGTLTSLPAANSTNYNAYKDKVWVYNGHAYSIIQSNNSYTWVDGGTAAGITASLYDWTSS